MTAPVEEIAADAQAKAVLDKGAFRLVVLVVSNSVRRVVEGRWEYLRVTT